jgi:hypothetical protein
MQEQKYANHRRFVPLYHIVTFLALVLTIIGACVNLANAFGDNSRLYNASLILVLSVVVFSIYVYARVFALRAQDRAIRAEENFRHFLLTGKPLDPKLTLRQIVGLRFASDEEFTALAARALKENLTEDQVKREVKHWRADHDRA